MDTLGLLDALIIDYPRHGLQVKPPPPTPPAPSVTPGRSTASLEARFV